MRTPPELISGEKPFAAGSNADVASIPPAGLFWWSPYFERVENVVGFFLQALLILTFGFLFFASSIEQLVELDWYAIVAVIGLLLWLRLDLPWLWHIWRITYDGGYPLFVAAAMRQRLLAVPLRPIAAIWWLSHFWFGLMFALIATAKADEALPPSQVLGLMIVSFMCCFAANGYLIQVAASFTRSKATLSRIWSIRIPIDLIVAIAGPLIVRALDGPT